MKKRLLSALVMILILVPTLLIGNNIFKIAVTLISLLALNELLELKDIKDRFPKFLKILSFLLLIIFTLGKFNKLGISISFLLFLLPTIFDSHYKPKNAFYLVSIILFLGFISNQVIVIRNRNIHLMIYLLLISSITDVFAYLIGRQWGKRKISPKISPNKTWAGCIGGSLTSTIVCSLYYLYFLNHFHIWLTCLMTLLLSIIGQLGDLFFSKIKRENKIKDYSNLIPGHGGILDRLDSFIFIVLVYLLFIENV